MKNKQNLTREQWIEEAAKVAESEYGFGRGMAVISAEDLAKIYYDLTPNKSTPAEAWADDFNNG